jgi:trans-2,3-dihydro-3-hydroxyanthranilate isomerase
MTKCAGQLAGNHITALRAKREVQEPLKMRLQFETVDVFTHHRFSGNPLAVVLNAEGLSTQQMQAIAAEFNLAETTFVLPPKDSAHTAEVRIFTPRAEMPFAGHPNVGTAFVLARAGASYGRDIAGDHVMFEEKAGLVPISLLKDGATVVGARLASPQPLTVSAEIATELIASACGVTVDDIEIRNHRPCIASCGAAFILTELKTREALAAASPRADVFGQEVAKHPATSILLYTQVDEHEIDIRARMFAPQHGIPEDPATGSANVALIGLLAKLRAEPDLQLSKTIAQGVEMGRPSLLEAHAEKRGGVVTATYIGGRCVPVMSGSIDLV